MQYYSAWMPEEEVIAQIAITASGGDATAARLEYVRAAQAGAIDIRGRRGFSFSADLEIIPAADWLTAWYQELLDRQASGFFFSGKHWCDREARRADVEALWQRPKPPGKKPGPEPETQRRAEMGMRAMLDDGTYTPQALADEKGDVLAKLLAVSRGTAVKARKEVLRGICQSSNSDKQ